MFHYSPEESQVCQLMVVKISNFELVDNFRNSNNILIVSVSVLTFLSASVH